MLTRLEFGLAKRSTQRHSERRVRTVAVEKWKCAGLSHPLGRGGWKSQESNNVVVEQEELEFEALHWEHPKKDWQLKKGSAPARSGCPLGTFSPLVGFGQPSMAFHKPFLKQKSNSDTIDSGL